jgi:hypothetical protein
MEYFRSMGAARKSISSPLPFVVAGDGERKKKKKKAVM